MIDYNEKNYLNNFPEDIGKYGFSKVFIVRKEMIHIKHIFTELFIRKTVPLISMLDGINMDMMKYMEIMTGRMRRIHKFPRSYYNDCKEILEFRKNDFFKFIDLCIGLRMAVVLDYDGVCTNTFFQNIFYNRIIENKNIDIIVCSANPNVTKEYFDKNGLPRPHVIYPMKGKIKKIIRLIEIQKAYDMTFFIDNEMEYLNYAWMFGIQTYHYVDRKIKYYTLKTK